MKNKRRRLPRRAAAPRSEWCKRRKIGEGRSRADRRAADKSQVHSNFTSLLLKVEPFKRVFHAIGGEGLGAA